MARKPRSKAPLTEAERLSNFKELAREVGASDDPKDFEKAFEGLVGKALPERNRDSG